MPEPIRPQIADFKANGITELAGVEFGHGGYQTLYMDCFFLPEAKKPMPAIVWIHGGGFIEADHTRLSRPEKAFVALAKRGYFIASIDYRLAQHTPFPAQIEDSKCAVRFLRANAARFGVDPDRIGVWGESCGGQLAGLMAVQEGIEGFEGTGGWPGVPSTIKAAVAWYGGFDILSFTNLINDPAFSLIYGGPLEEKRSLVIKASPSTYVSKKLCPILAMCSDTDNRVPDAQSLNFCNAAREHGNIAEYVMVPGQGHGYFEGDEYYEKIYGFFDKYLKG